MKLTIKLANSLYKQGQYHRKIREYFYYISHEGYLFLDDSRMKNFTAAYKDRDFLNFFYKNLRINDTTRYMDSFPYWSRCGRESNYLRCDDRPIVFTEITAVNGEPVMRIGDSSQMVAFEPTQLSMLANGRLYHPAPFADYGLVRSSLADSLFPLFSFDSQGYPRDFKWNGSTYILTNDILKKTGVTLLDRP